VDPQPDRGVGSQRGAHRHVRSGLRTAESRAARPPQAGDPVAEVIDRACAHGDEHVIKFTDTAAWVYQQTADPDALAAALECTRLLTPPSS
jgi:hypothetical protein